MNINCFFECPSCKKEMETVFDIGEHFSDLPETCDYCDYKFTAKDILDIQDELEEQSAGAAMDYLSDRDYN